MCVQSVDSHKIKTHHLAANTAHALHDTVESYIPMCFKYFRWSERAPQTQRTAHMKPSYVCHQLHRCMCTCARHVAASPNHTHILHMQILQAARRACIQRTLQWQEAHPPPAPNQLKSITTRHTGYCLQSTLIHDIHNNPRVHIYMRYTGTHLMRGRSGCLKQGQQVSVCMETERAY